MQLYNIIWKTFFLPQILVVYAISEQLR